MNRAIALLMKLFGKVRNAECGVRKPGRFVGPMRARSGWGLPMNRAIALLMKLFGKVRSAECGVRKPKRFMAPMRVRSGWGLPMNRENLPARRLRRRVKRRERRAPPPGRGLQPASRHNGSWPQYAPMLVSGLSMNRTVACGHQNTRTR